LMGQFKKRIAYYNQCSYRVLVREFGETEFHDTSKPKSKSKSKSKTKETEQEQVEGPLFK
jgi:hypothetical protein